MIIVEISTWIVVGIIAAFFKAYLLDESPSAVADLRTVAQGLAGGLAGGVIGHYLVAAMPRWTGTGVLTLLFATAGAIAVLVLQPGSKRRSGNDGAHMAP